MYENSSSLCAVCDAPVPANAGNCGTCGTDLQSILAPPDAAITFYNRALDFAGQGNRRAAIEQAQAAVAADAHFVDAWIVLGKLLGQAGEIERALTCWSQASASNPDGDQMARIAACRETIERHLAASRSAAERKQSEEQALQRATRRVAQQRGVQFSALSLVGGLVIGLLVPHPIQRSDTDPIRAVVTAIAMPDIQVTRNGNRIALQGTVASEQERRLVISAAQLAAQRPIDATPLIVRSEVGGDSKPVVTTPPDMRARAMQMTLNALTSTPKGPSVWLGAQLHVRAGTGATLSVTGACFDPKIPRFVTMVAQKLDPGTTVDVGGIVVQPRHYRVVAGDTWWDITEKMGQSGSQWRQLWRANARNFPDPANLHVGAILLLPSGWHLGGG